MLSNAYFLAKFRFDTAKNEPAKNLQNVANFPNFANSSWSSGRGGGGLRGERRAVALGLLESPLLLREERRAVRLVASFGKISAICCSFSAVSTPIFASKYAFCSIFQNLPNYLAEFFEICQILQILQHNDLKNFAEFSRKLLIFQTSLLLEKKTLRLQRCKSMHIL